MVDSGQGKKPGKTYPSPQQVELLPLAKKLAQQKKKKNYQMRKNTHFGLYEYIQVDLAYSSSRLTSNRLTRKQVLEIYRTGKISVAFEPMKIDDLIEIISHFSACHHMIETLAEPPTAPYIRKLHRLMFHGTLADRCRIYRTMPVSEQDVNL